MMENKKIVWYVVVVILVLGAFAFGRDAGWKAGTADTLSIFENYYSPEDYMYPQVDDYAAPMYPQETDYLYPQY